MRNTIGGKGVGLSELKEQKVHNYIIPDFDIINTSFFPEIEHRMEVGKFLDVLQQRVKPDTSTQYKISSLTPDLEVMLDELTEKYQGKDVKVRSSSVNEDSKHSFAGIYESYTVKNTDRDRLRAAIIDVYNSINAPKAIKYRKEKNIENDQMAVIVQEFIEGDFSGVMFTHNPQSPEDLSIEFSSDPDAVVDGRGNTYILDYHKQTMQEVFRSERMPNLKDSFNTPALARLGIKLGRKFGPSDIEFIIKRDAPYDDKIHIVQKRDITNLAPIKRVRIPDYPEEQFLGKTHFCRGRGKLTAPVVHFQYITNLLDGLSMLAHIDPKGAMKEITNYYKNIIEMDRRYSKGYICVTPHFPSTPINHTYEYLEGYPYHTTIDDITKNKLAVITSKWSGNSSHMMTIARERGLMYVSLDGNCSPFGDNDDQFSNARTGDILSIYFKGREAYIYKEISAPKSLKESHPDISVKVIEEEEGMAFEAPWETAFTAITNDFHNFLNENTSKKWQHHEINGLLSSAYVDENGCALILSGHSMYGEHYGWKIHPKPEDLFCDGVPFCTDATDRITKEYIQYLKE